MGESPEGDGTPSVFLPELCLREEDARDVGLTLKVAGKLGLGRNLCITFAGADPGRAS